MTDRTYDVIVFGATGFTGRLVCQHLLTRDGVRWAMAGRSQAKLDEVAAEIGAIDVPTIVADSGDAASLAAMAASTKVLCSTVGPYAKFGTPVVEACVAASTDYVDLTGEVQWLRRMVDTQQDAAVASGARIVHSCGFDSIPSDLGTLFAQQSMQDQHGVHSHRVRLRVKGAKGGISGGTIASLVNMLDEASEDPTVNEAITDPYSLLPAGERIGPHAPDRTTAEYDDAFGSWVAPFMMEAINARVVRRSNALLDYPWGRDFHYGEAIMVGDGVKGRARATALAVGSGIGQSALTVDAIRALAGRVLPGAGTGPAADARESGYFDIRILAEHPTDPMKNVTVKVVGDRDPGYGATARMLGEAALTLAAGESDVAGGVWTPASALGRPLIDRLEAHAGITFEVL